MSDVDEQVGYANLIVELAEENRLRAIYPLKMFVEAGGLMSYGTDASLYGYNVADIVGQTLKGRKTKRNSNPPGDQIRTGDLSQGGKGAWSHHARHAACGRR